MSTCAHCGLPDKRIKLEKQKKENNKNNGHSKNNEMGCDPFLKFGLNLVWNVEFDFVWFET